MGGIEKDLDFGRTMRGCNGLDSGSFFCMSLAGMTLELPLRTVMQLF